MEESSHDIIEVLFRQLPAGSEEDHEKSQSSPVTNSNPAAPNISLPRHHTVQSLTNQQLEEKLSELNGSQAFSESEILLNSAIYIMSLMCITTPQYFNPLWSACLTSNTANSVAARDSAVNYFNNH